MNCTLDRIDSYPDLIIEDWPVRIQSEVFVWQLCVLFQVVFEIPDARWNTACLLSVDLFIQYYQIVSLVNCYNKILIHLYNVQSTSVNSTSLKPNNRLNRTKLKVPFNSLYILCLKKLLKQNFISRKIA